MPVTESILAILASLLGVVASWYVGKKLVLWIQAYRTQRQKSEVEEARKAAQKANQKANEESDKLRETDGR